MLIGSSSFHLKSISSTGWRTEKVTKVGWVGDVKYLLNAGASGAFTCWCKAYEVYITLQMVGSMVTSVTWGYRSTDPPCSQKSTMQCKTCTSSIDSHVWMWEVWDSMEVSLSQTEPKQPNRSRSQFTELRQRRLRWERLESSRSPLLSHLGNHTLTTFQCQVTALYIHGEFEQSHLAGSCYAHISKIQNLAIAFNQCQLIRSEDFVVISVGDVSVWKPYPLHICTTQCKHCFRTVSQAFIHPLLSKVNKYLEFLKRKQGCKPVHNDSLAFVCAMKSFWPEVENTVTIFDSLISLNAFIAMLTFTTSGLPVRQKHAFVT